MKDLNTICKKSSDDIVEYFPIIYTEKSHFSVCEGPMCSMYTLGKLRYWLLNFPHML